MEVFDNKTRKAFRFFDLDQDGILTKNEVIKLADKISSLSNASLDETNSTRKHWTKWCVILFPNGQITEEDFLTRSRSVVVTHPEAVKEENVLTYGDMFERLDSNKDGFISPEELRLYYKAFGYGDDYDIDQIFRMMDDNNDGLISRDEFVTAAVTYWSNEPGFEFFFDPPKKED